MKADLGSAGRAMFEPPDLSAGAWNQTALRGLNEAVIFEPATGQVMMSAGLMPAPAPSRRRPGDGMANAGDVAVLGNDNSTRVRALVKLDATPALMMQISGPVDPAILDHMANTEKSAALYERLDENLSGLQLTFALIFALVALLVLAAAVLIGLVMANQIARPGRPADRRRRAGARRRPRGARARGRQRATRWPGCAAPSTA